MSLLRHTYVRWSVMLIMLLAILDAPFIGWMVEVSQHMAIKREFEELLKQGTDGVALTEFVFTDSEFQALDWEDDQEFQHQGHFFDVVTHEVIRQGHRLLCYSDIQEEVIDQQADDLAKKSTQFNQHFKSVLKYLPLDLIFVKIDLINENSYQLCSNDGMLNESFSGIFIPPPDHNIAFI